MDLDLISLSIPVVRTRAARDAREVRVWISPGMRPTYLCMSFPTHSAVPVLMFNL